MTDIELAKLLAAWNAVMDPASETNRTQCEPGDALQEFAMEHVPGMLADIERLRSALYMIRNLGSDGSRPDMLADIAQRALEGSTRFR